MRLAPAFLAAVLVSCPAAVPASAPPAPAAKSRPAPSARSAARAESRKAPSAPTTVQRGRYLMGTLCTMMVETRDTTAAVAAIDSALDEVARLEQVMSSWRETSELSRLNAAAGKDPFACSPDLWSVVGEALSYAAASGGTFDPTVEPLDRAWDLRGEGRVPSDAELARATALVGWKSVERDSSRRTLRLPRAGMGLDLGGIGKGWALDRAGAIVKPIVIRALLNFGGETLALGPSQRVTLADPADRMRPVIALDVENAAVSTSAQSERGFESGGRRYGHIVDPRTGRPVDTRATVAVISPSGTRADAWSTALLVGGRDAAAKVAAANPSLGVIWMEPAAHPGDFLHVWIWNVTELGPSPMPGVSVQWMNHTP